MAILRAIALRICAGGVLTAMLLASFLATGLSAQTGDNRPDYQIKAAFLFNFAKFVEWPPGSFKNPTDPINLCVLGVTLVGRALEDTVRNKLVDGRALAVRELTNVHQAADCQILFVSVSEQKRLRAIIDASKFSDVLTVGETDTFIAEGGVLAFNLDNGRIHFDINLQAAQLERLRVSSKLVSLATSVRKAEK